ncbi:MAG: hypothetical protein WBQ06_20315, partial [Acidobacteriaceae bacterium]
MKKKYWFSIVRPSRQDIEGQPMQNENTLFELVIQSGNGLRNVYLFVKASSRWLRSFRNPQLRKSAMAVTTRCCSA